MFKCEKHLTIGVPVRDEEQVLTHFFDSLHKAVCFMPSDIEIETIVCLNGTTDDSESVVDYLIDKYAASRLMVKKIHSKQGKIVAQEAIIKNAKQGGRVCFIDADVKIREDCLSRLWFALESNESLQVAYAAVHPIYSKKMNLVEKLQQSHYDYRHLLSIRKYFHGRTFMLQSKKIFVDSIYDTGMDGHSESKDSTWNLRGGPRVDDIYLSRVIVHKYGLESIREIADAKVRFIPPRTLSDFYHGQRRMIVEIKRLDVLFPEHAYVQKKHFSRKVSWKKLFQLPKAVISWYLLYFCFERIIQSVIKFFIILTYFGVNMSGESWVSLTSTKVFKEIENEL